MEAYQMFNAIDNKTDTVTICGSEDQEIDKFSVVQDRHAKARK